MRGRRSTRKETIKLNFQKGRKPSIRDKEGEFLNKRISIITVESP